MSTNQRTPKRSPYTKRKAWIAVFAGSALFWAVIAMLAWHVWG